MVPFLRLEFSSSLSHFLPFPTASFYLYSPLTLFSSFRSRFFVRPRTFLYGFRVSSSMKKLRGYATMSVVKEANELGGCLEKRTVVLSPSIASSPYFLSLAVFFLFILFQLFCPSPTLPHFLAFSISLSIALFFLS